MGLVLALSASTLGCGSATHDPVVRIGQTSIESATVKHWERALSLRAPITSSRAYSLESRHAKAIDYLISAHWLIREAEQRGLAIPAGTVKRYVEARLGFHVSLADINKKLSATGRTMSDVELEARAVLSAIKLREAILGQAPRVTRTEVVGYYTRHRDSFRRERRVVDLIEQLASRSAATALAHRLGPGRRFVKRAMHETVSRPTRYGEEHDLNASLVRAIYAAPLHKIAMPVLYVGNWVIFVVRGVERGPLPLTEAEGLIAEQLQALHRKQTLAAFIVKYRREWRAKTTCRTGFVVAECSESRENLESEAIPLPEA